jgi:hypothetical protein
MWTRARRDISITFAMAVACGVLAASWAAAEPLQHRVAPKAKDARAAPAHAPATRAPQARAAAGHAPQAHRSAEHGHAVTFRAPRGAASADAKRLGALVGKECTGRADMQRSEQEWVVLCSNGKTFVVEPAAPRAAATPVECSLAGIGPEPACFP